MNTFKSQAGGRQLRVMFYTLLGFAAIAAIFWALYSLDNFPNVMADPLYTDLTQNTVYVKRGFDPDMLTLDANTLTQESTMQWDAVVPPEYTGNYTISSLLAPGKTDGHSFFSPVRSTVQDYTIMIPFMQDAAAALCDIHTTLGLSLSGIGENWEVYINGTLVASAMHRDTSGFINFYRSQRSVHCPISRDVLLPGVNTIVFHIAASYHSSSAGLFYASGYYIGNYAEIVTRATSPSTIILCSIYIFMGLYHLLVYLMRRTERYNLSYCFFTITSAMYFLSRTSLIYLLFPDTSLAERFECSALYLLPLSLAMFMDQMGRGKIKPLIKIYAALCFVLIAVQAVLPIDALSDTLLIGQLGCAVMVLYAIVFDAVLPLTRMVRTQRQTARQPVVTILFQNLLHEPIGNIFIAILFIAVTTFFDIFDALFFHTGIVLSRYSFFLFTISVAFILARRTANAFTQISTENQTLEAAVSARTAELEEQVRIAEVASRAKSDFLSNMSHEIRTPINAVIGMTNIGKHADSLEKKDYSLGKIAEASAHLLRVINDILDMSKIEANKLELSETQFHVREAILRVTDMTRVKAEEKQQLFHLSYDDNIPSVLFGDEQRLMQVIVNLFSNAIKFTPEHGSVTLLVFLKAETETTCTLGVEVTDTGIGISPEQQQCLFASFQQADNSTARLYGGTGLGLALSKRIVEVMNGSISVQSVPGEGATFSFTVTLRKVTATAPTVSPEASEQSAEPLDGEFDGLTALLAEDISINAEIVLALLESSLLRFEIARNGQEALELYSRDPDKFDVVLMDVQMPVMDGYMATRAIRALPHPRAKTVPIIAMTANVFKEDVDNCLDSGMNAHVGKPLDLAELTTVIRRYLS